MKRRALGLALVLLMIFTAGCGLAESSTIATTDMMDRSITLTEPVTRVVALTAADCEILYALGAGDLLVGRGAYCDYPADVLEVSSVESGYETNIEQIIELEPQLVLMATMAQSEEQVEMLEAAGIAVAVSNAQDIEGVYEAITMIGTLTGHAADAALLIANMQETFASLADNATEGTVYFEVSPLEYGLWTAGNGTFLQEVSDMLGLTNVFADLDGWAQISEEQVLERNPDYIVTLASDYGQEPSPVEEIVSRAGWDNVTAIQNSAVFSGFSDSLTRPGPRLADGAQQLLDTILAN